MMTTTTKNDNRVAPGFEAGAADTSSLFFEPVEIKSIANKIAICASTSKYDLVSVLSTINFDVRDKRLHVCATDGSRLAHGEFRASGIYSSFNKNVPAKEFITASRAASAKKMGFYLVVRDSVFVIHDHDYNQLASGNLIEGRYPRYVELFPDESKLQSINLLNIKSAMRFGSHSPVEALAEAAEQIEQASYIPENKKDSAKHGLITLNFSRNEKRALEVDCNITMVHDFFEYKRTVLVNDEDRLLDRFKVTFCAKFLVQALNHDHDITMFYSAPLNPVVFRYKASSIRHLLMPVQIK